jgi:hypothetical protein
LKELLVDALSIVIVAESALVMFKMIDLFDDKSVALFVA